MARCHRLRFYIIIQVLYSTGWKKSYQNIGIDERKGKSKNTTSDIEK